jgi:hypothetical protein
MIPQISIFTVPHMGRVTAILGLAILVVEGMQQLNQYQSNWISYRSTCKALRHEKFLYLGKAGPYKEDARPQPLLAERVEGLVPQEHAKWLSVQEHRTESGKKTNEKS